MKQTVSQLTIGFHPELPTDVTFDGPDTSSDGGLLLLRQADMQLGLCKWFSSLLPDERMGSRVQHDRLEQVRQRIYQIACGYEDCNDANHLRHDPLLKTVCDRTPTDAGLSSQPTLTRLENAVTGKALRLLTARFEDEWVSSLPADTTEVILDIDATDDETHGEQQLSFFHGFYEEHCFLPLLVFDGVSGQLVTAMLRPGNVHASRSAGPTLERIIRKVKSRFPNTSVIVRADSGFCIPRDLERYERLNAELGEVDYLIGVGKNHVLLLMAKDAMDEAERRYHETRRHVRSFTDLRYAAKTWSHKRYVAVKAEHDAKGPNPRFVVTSLSGFSPRIVYNAYCERGQCENFIKDFKNALKADRLSCHRYLANSFRLLLHLAAYRLMHKLRTSVREVSPELGRAQFDTLRLKLLKVAALITKSVRRLLVRLPKAFPLAGVFAALSQRLAMDSS